MVGVGGDGGRQGAAKDLGIVELGTARIGSRDNDSADRVTRAVRDSAFAELKKSGILVQQRGKNRARHEVLNGPIRKGRGKALSVTFPALAVTGFAVFCLADGR